MKAVWSALILIFSIAAVAEGPAWKDPANEIININGCFEDLNQNWGDAIPGARVVNDLEKGLDQATQVISMDPKIVKPGALSALITPDGKVIQIMKNGSCELAPKTFDSVYDFIAKQMAANPKKALAIKETISDEARESIQHNCSKLPTRAPFDKIRSFLVRAGVLNSPTQTPESDGASAAH